MTTELRSDLEIAQAAGVRLRDRLHRDQDGLLVVHELRRLIRLVQSDADRLSRVTPRLLPLVTAEFERRLAELAP